MAINKKNMNFFLYLEIIQKRKKILNESITHILLHL